MTPFRVVKKGARGAGRSARPSPRVLGVIAVALTFAAGASDVASFTRLGNVFTSVMTGNMAVFGLALARGSLSLALHTLLAVCGYALGVAAGTRLACLYAGRGDGQEWSPHLTLALLAEWLLYAGVVAGWEATGSLPSGATQYTLLALAACAMGIQSATVNQMGIGNVSTTYLTGTLTALVAALVRRDGKPVGWRRQSVLLGLVTGATLAGLCVAYAAAVTPLLPLAAIGTATVLESGYLPHSGTIHLPRWVRRGSLQGSVAPAHPFREGGGWRHGTPSWGCNGASAPLRGCRVGGGGAELMASR